MKYREKSHYLKEKSHHTDDDMVTIFLIKNFEEILY